MKGLMVLANINIDDLHGGIISPVDCGYLKFFTAYSILMFGTSLFFNSLLLYAFVRNKELRIPINLSIMTLTACNLFGSFSEMQFIIPSTFFCRHLIKSFEFYFTIYSQTF
jgi:hypothetical protein